MSRNLHDREGVVKSSGQLFTVPAKLTERQKFVMECVTSEGSLDARQAGSRVHTRFGCSHCGPYRICQYAESNGRAILEALKGKGLLKRDRHHIYRRTEQPASTTPIAPAEDPADIFGF
jgi:hypothetical protein